MKYKFYAVTIFSMSHPATEMAEGREPLIFKVDQTPFPSHPIDLHFSLRGFVTSSVIRAFMDTFQLPSKFLGSVATYMPMKLPISLITTLCPWVDIKRNYLFPFLLVSFFLLF